MKKKRIKLLMIISLFILVIFLWANTIYRIYSGYRYFILKAKEEFNNTDLVLFCKQKVRPGFFVNFYHVTFSLRNKYDESFEIGDMIISYPNWDRDIQIVEVDDWILILDPETKGVCVLMANFNRKIKKDTCLYPIVTEIDSLYVSVCSDAHYWEYRDYTGNSGIDSINENRLFITYEYQIGQNEPYKFFRKSITYELNLLTGDLIAKSLSNRIDF